ncbi:MAG: M43 family zinc metalloprotease [Flavobacteriales bacterium]|nr:M43 family zinc metalloprotease [Flavobacteriales bacterium]
MRYLAVLLTLLGAYTYAQDANLKVSCGFDKNHEHLLNTSPNYKNNVEQNRQFHLNQSLNNHPSAKSMKGIVHTIPTVFHILHIGEPIGTGSNISDAQVMSCIEALNRDFRRTAADGGIAQSGPLGVDAEIEFCLATIDPNGQSSTGINRVDATSVSGYGSSGIVDGGAGSNEQACKALSNWDHNEYLNVWVVQQINGQGDPLGSGYGGGIQGYAYFPGASAAVDGVVCLYSAVGNDPNGTKGFNLWSPTVDNRVMTHEVGHYLNLYHTFQGQSCTENNCNTEGDEICDTPPTTVGTGNDCANPQCSGTENKENYMQYQNGACAADFTQGQVDRMRDALVNMRSGLLNGVKCAPAYTNDALVAQANMADTMCSDSFLLEILVRNMGSADITSVEILYNLDGNPNSTLNWSGNLATGEDTILTVLLTGISLGNHILNIHADSTKINGSIMDEYGTNNIVSHAFVTLAKPNITVTTNATTFCQGDSVTYVATGGVQYFWNTNSTDDSTTFTLFSDFDLTVQVKGANGCYLTFKEPITVDTVPAYPFNPYNTVNMCIGGSATLTAGSPGPVNYAWSNGATTQSITVSPIDTMVYNITVTNTFGCTRKDSVTVNAYVFEAEILSSGPSVCLGSAGTLIGSPGISHLWSTGDTTQSIIIQPTTQTDYFITITDSTGCIDQDTVTIGIKIPDTVFVTPNLVQVCTGTPTTLSSSGALSYYWSNGDTIQTINIIPNTDTILTITVIDSNGCLGTAVAGIQVFDTITGVVITGNAFICAGDQTTLSASSGYGYSWSNGMTTQTITVNPTADTQYSLVVNSGNCKSDSLHTFVQVFDKPTAVATANKTTVATGENINFTHNSTGASTYLWDFDDGTTSNLPFETKSYSADGVYDVQLKAYNGICFDSSHILIHVGVFASIDDPEYQMNIRTFPIPTSDFINISYSSVPKGSSLDYRIINSIGQTVFQEVRMTNLNEQIDVAQLPPGYYQLDISGFDLKHTVPIIIEK